jgi:hypothetical protein
LEQGVSIHELLDENVIFKKFLKVHAITFAEYLIDSIVANGIMFVWKLLDKS